MMSDMKMKYYMAPMEGLTGYIYRSAYHAYYHPMDEYLTPFLSPKANSSLSFRELNDILPERSRGMYVAPQVFTSQAKDFIRTAEELQEYGYSEINLNLGCPSDTVVSKYKGAGLLGLPDSLDRSLGEVCEKVEGMNIELSIKARLGSVSSGEFAGLLEIHNHYPLKELILHPRVRTDYYKNTPNMPAFGSRFDSSRAPVRYNGDIFTVSGYETSCGDYPELDRVMSGHGIISNLGLLGRIAAGADFGETGTGREALRKLYQITYEDYQTIMSGDRNVLFKMKELWVCTTRIFSDSGKYIRRIKKSQRLEEYEAAAAAVFRNLGTMGGAGFHTY